MTKEKVRIVCGTMKTKNKVQNDNRNFPDILHYSRNLMQVSMFVFKFKM